MIYVAQGHEFGIGLEVFLKSFVCYSNIFQQEFLLVSFHSTLKKHQEFLDINYNIESNHLIFTDGTILKTIFLPEPAKLSQTTDSLIYCLENLNSKDILLTLPSSKDQFFYKNSMLSGHTEFFRKYYRDTNIGMSFLAADSNVLLLTDHIAIDEIIKNISAENIIEKFKHTYKSLQDVREISEVFFSGINPHCGEGGIISTSDNVISDSIIQLRSIYPLLKIHDMLPGDTIHFQMNSRDQLFVYAFHDQGLAPFKLKYGLSGINYTTGLPFKRVSVDHGTSFSLYGKNNAEYSGMLYLLSEIENWT